MKFLNILRGLWGTTNTEKTPDYAELSDKLIRIWARASLYPKVAKMWLNDLHSYRIFIEWIDAIWKTLSGVHAKFGVALIWLSPIENEVAENNLSDEEKTEIIRVVSEAIQAELILNEVIHFIRSIDKFLDSLAQDRLEVTQVGNDVKNYIDNLKQSITDLSSHINTTWNRISSILMLDNSFNSFMRPAYDTEWQINRAESDLKKLKLEAESLQEVFFSWIQARLDAVKQKRIETGLKLEWLQLFHNSGK